MSEFIYSDTMSASTYVGNINDTAKNIKFNPDIGTGKTNITATRNFKVACTDIGALVNEFRKVLNSDSKNIIEVANNLQKTDNNTASMIKTEFSIK